MQCELVGVQYIYGLSVASLFLTFLHILLLKFHQMLIFSSYALGNLRIRRSRVERLNEIPSICLQRWTMGGRNDPDAKKHLRSRFSSCLFCSPQRRHFVSLVVYASDYAHSLHSSSVIDFHIMLAIFNLHSSF